MPAPKDRRLTILLLSDSIRGHSGVGRMAMEIVKKTVNEFNWIHVSPETLPDSELRKLDMSGMFSQLTGVHDASVMVIPYQNFGDIELIRLLLHKEPIDAIFIFHDPRYWEWLFDHEHEIRQLVPILYYNIWDNEPAPYYNRGYYESVDALIAISKLTERINKTVLSGSKYNPQITRVPHGIDEKVFYPITPFDTNYEPLQEFKNKLVGVSEFNVLYNSRNMDRKNVMGVIEAFNTFNIALEPSKQKSVKLILHTNPVDQVGTDLICFVAHNVKFKENIIFSTEVYDDLHMNYLYNTSDVTISLSHTEGWGLSLTESGLSGTPIIAIKTGGMADQLFEGCTFSLEPEVRSLAGSLPTPYIYCDRVSNETAAKSILDAYNQKENLESMGYSLREHMINAGYTTSKMGKGITNALHDAVSTFRPKPDYTITKI